MMIIAGPTIGWIITAFIAYDLNVLATEWYWRIIFILIAGAVTVFVLLERKDYINSLRENPRQ